MATNNTAPATKVVVPCRISFANIWEPKSINGSEEKYSVSCLIPKEDKATLAKIKKAIEAAKEAAKEKKPKAVCRAASQRISIFRLRTNSRRSRIMRSVTTSSGALCVTLMRSCISAILNTRMRWLATTGSRWKV